MHRWISYHVLTCITQVSLRVRAHVHPRVCARCMLPPVYTTSTQGWNMYTCQYTVLHTCQYRCQCRCLDMCWLHVLPQKSAHVFAQPVPGPREHARVLCLWHIHECSRCGTAPRNQHHPQPLLGAGMLEVRPNHTTFDLSSRFTSALAALYPRVLVLRRLPSNKILAHRVICRPRPAPTQLFQTT